jgi:hypothetical protein
MDESDLEPLAIVSSSAQSVRLRSSDGHTPIEVVIECKVLEDYFRLSSSSAQERLDIVKANLEAIMAAVTGRYRHRNVSTIHRIGTWIIEIVIERTDLRAAHPKMPNEG